MRRLLVNDMLSALGERTFWRDLLEWFSMEFVGGEYGNMEEAVARNIHDSEQSTSLIVRNCSYFAPLSVSAMVPTVSLLQDIFTTQAMQQDVMRSSRVVVFNSDYTRQQYAPVISAAKEWRVIPLPVDFTAFEPQNAMGCQQALGLPDGCIIWVGASQGPAGHVKGFDIFLKIVRMNPDLHFVGVFKDAIPESFPPNLRCYMQLTHEELVKVIGACRVGLCTSRTESQHLAGIEMGVCGLPMVAPNVGCYWNREDMPGILVKDSTPANFTTALRVAHREGYDNIRDYWRKEFDRGVIRKQWEALVLEVENAPTR